MNVRVIRCDGEARGFPVPWHRFGDAASGMIRQSCEHVGSLRHHSERGRAQSRRVASTPIPSSAEARISCAATPIMAGSISRVRPIIICASASVAAAAIFASERRRPHRASLIAAACANKIVQVTMEANTRLSITALTSGSAERNIDQGESSCRAIAVGLASDFASPPLREAPARPVARLPAECSGTSESADSRKYADSGPLRTVIPTHCGQHSGDRGQLLMTRRHPNQQIDCPCREQQGQPMAGRAMTPPLDWNEQQRSLGFA
jgi:hypothetical protein